MLKNEVIPSFDMTVWDLILLYQPFKVFSIFQHWDWSKPCCSIGGKYILNWGKVESDFLSLMRWLHRRSVWFRLYQIVCSVLQNKVLLFWEIFGQFSMNWKKGSSQTFQMSLQKGNKTCLHPENPSSATLSPFTLLNTQ